MKYYKDNISVVILDVYHYVGKDKIIWKDGL